MRALMSSTGFGSRTPSRNTRSWPSREATYSAAGSPGRTAAKSGSCSDATIVSFTRAPPRSGVAGAVVAGAAVVVGAAVVGAPVVGAAAVVAADVVAGAAVGVLAAADAAVVVSDEPRASSHAATASRATTTAAANERIIAP